MVVNGGVVFRRGREGREATRGSVSFSSLCKAVLFSHRFKSLLCGIVPVVLFWTFHCCFPFCFALPLLCSGCEDAGAEVGQGWLRRECSAFGWLRKAMI